MANRTDQFTDGMTGRPSNGGAGRAGVGALRGIGLMAVATSGVWFPVFLFAHSAHLLLGESHGDALEPGERFVSVYLPWVVLSLMANVVYGVKLYRRRGIAPDARWAETARSRNLALVACLGLVGTILLAVFTGA